MTTDFQTSSNVTDSAECSDHDEGCWDKQTNRVFKALKRIGVFGKGAPDANGNYR
jgi:hypothetical protein